MIWRSSSFSPMTSLVNGFMTYSSAPASRALIDLGLSVSVVTMMTGTACWVCPARRARRKS